MPELPEVETIVTDLRELVIAKTIVGADIITKSVWRTCVPDPRQLIGASILTLTRKGKNILLSLSNDRTLIVHLKMTGRLTFVEPDMPRPKHTHFVMRLDGGELRFNDIRRFGYLDLVATERLNAIPYLSHLGPDPLRISEQEFVRLIKSKSRIIKSLLLDQIVISGIGNIYSDEALFLAQIQPRRVSSRLSEERAGRLHDALVKTLKKAIRARGSSVDNYVDGKGGRGRYQEHFLVYGREGEPCRRCGRPIRRARIGSRSCHYCPHCQR